MFEVAWLVFGALIVSAGTIHAGRSEGSFSCLWRPMVLSREAVSKTENRGFALVKVSGRGVAEGGWGRPLSKPNKFTSSQKVFAELAPSPPPKPNAGDALVWLFCRRAAVPLAP